MNEETQPEFIGFPKIARFNRDIVITEKIDGTNAQIFITDGGDIFAGSRSRWLTPGANDNFGFAAWVEGNKTELLKLGPGRHWGEWWGAGIQRRYDQTEKIFSLFDVSRWVPAEFAIGTRFEESNQRVVPTCCRVVPVLYRGLFSEVQIILALGRLRKDGSVAAPGFMQPEGIVVYHTAANVSFKVTLENDERPKTKGQP